jgi:exosome complex component RRP45
VTALAHFRRPDCTTSGDGEFTIHKSSEKDLIPTVLHHYPICVTYALFEGKVPIADPTYLEERVMNANIILAINSYRELCSMHLTGVSLTSPFLIQKCSEMAADRAKHTVEFIKDSLEQDRIDREKGEIKGFSQSIKLTNILSNFCDEQQIECVPMVAEETVESDEEMEDTAVDGSSNNFKKVDGNTIATKWKDQSEESSSSSGSEIDIVAGVHKQPQQQQKMPKPETIEINSSDEDEEKETIVLN